MWRGLERWLGLVRSLIIYWRPGRQRGLRELYRPFVGAGDLAFDVGAHLGDRTHAFRKLGACVVALEPQPAVRRWLMRFVGRSEHVSIRAEALGREVGTARLALSRRTPTVSSLAEDWPNALPERNPSFRGVRWDDSVEVQVTTLDALIEQYGLPRFCKIDVEGYEAEVLAGLSHRIPALSVEFEFGGSRVRGFVGGDSAALFFWVGDRGRGIHLANLTAGMTFGSPRLRTGPFVTGGIYGEARKFLSIHEYTHVERWVKQIAERPAVRRGRIVNKTWGEENEQLSERHSSSDFDGKNT